MKLKYLEQEQVYKLKAILKECILEKYCENKSTYQMFHKQCEYFAKLKKSKKEKNNKQNGLSTNSKNNNKTTIYKYYPTVLSNPS